LGTLREFVTSDQAMNLSREDFQMSKSRKRLCFLLAATAVSLWHGSAGRGQTITLQSPNEEIDGFFGETIAALPDVTGDGHDDIIVGTTWETVSGNSDAGRVYVFNGITGALWATLQAPVPTVQGYFGLAACGISDLNGDGRGEILVGSINYTSHPDGVPGGRVFIYSGGVSGLNSTPLAILRSPNAELNSFFGRSIAGVPDVNADAKDDILVSAYGESPGGGQSGRQGLCFFRGHDRPEQCRPAHADFSECGSERILRLQRRRRERPGCSRFSAAADRSTTGKSWRLAGELRKSLHIQRT
jgi:hypothetical protein